MTFIETERELLQKLEETNYNLFDGDKEDALDFIEEQLLTFPQYANVVIREQIMLPMWRVRYDGQDLRDKIENIDKSRRNAHNAAITAINVLNRLATQLDCPLFTDIDTNDRYQVADFIGKVINEIYYGGINPSASFDDVTLNKDTEYDVSKCKIN